MTILASVLNKFGPYTLEDKIFIVWVKLAIAFGLFIVILFLKNVLVKYIIKIINGILNKLDIKDKVTIISSFEKPIKNFLLILGIYIIVFTGFDILGLKKQILNRILKTAFVMCIAQGFINSVNTPISLLNKFYDNEVKLDKIAYSFIAKFIKVAILIICILIIAEIWGIEVKGLVAGAGIGGAVLALAAKDTAANIVAGISIIFDRSFSIGDWIQCNNIEGEVEDISLRSTKVRTVDKVLITVPNSMLANTSILNFTRRDMRRVTFNIGLTYGTEQEKMKNVISEIKNMLNESEDVLNDGILVNFDKYNDSSLDISIAYYTNKVKLDEYLKVKNNINFKIMDIIELQDTSIAFPSTTVYINKEE